MDVSACASAASSMLDCRRSLILGGGVGPSGGRAKPSSDQDVRVGRLYVDVEESIEDVADCMLAAALFSEVRGLCRMAKGEIAQTT